MKKLINYTFISAVFVVIFFVSSCTNPLLDTNIKEGGEGSFALQVAVPNYDLHFTQDVSTMAVSPDSRVIAVYFDKTIGEPAPGPQIENWLYNDWEVSNESNGFFYTLYQHTNEVPAGFFERVRVELRPGYGMPAITSGEASNVTVAAGAEVPTTISVTLTPPAGMFTPIGSVPYMDTIGYEGMRFYSFDTLADAGADLLITPTFGEPDVYLFNEMGLRTGLEYGHDFAYTADPADLSPVGLPVTLEVYREILQQTYYVGVYGWRNGADYEISVVDNPIAITRPAPPGPPVLTDIQLLVDQAVDVMANNPDGRPDFEEAFSLFTAAHTMALGAPTDPGYGMAVAGYNALYMMKLMTDPDIVYTARNVLGLTDYATNMTELFSGEWMQVYTTPEGWDNILPRIIGQESMDGALSGIPDGIIDPGERLVAFMNFFIHNSLGFGDVADLALAKLGDRLDFAIQQIMDMDPTIGMVFTWDMIYENFERDVVEYQPGKVSYNWPVDEHGAPIPIKLGKPELLGLASILKIVESFINIGKAYEYNFIDPDTGINVLVDYWADFNPLDGPGYDPQPTGNYLSDVTPFETGFLMPKPDAGLSMNTARTSFLDALDILQFAIGLIRADERGEGFLLSSTSPMPGIGGDDWDNFMIPALDFANLAVFKARDSVNDPELPLIVPIDFFNREDFFAWYAYGHWPEMVMPPESVGINLHLFFLNPMAFLLELSPEGEPVWYEFTPYEVYFDPVTSIDPSIEGSVFFARVPDLTLGGVLPPENLDFMPIDDPFTRARLVNTWNNYFDWDDWSSGMTEYDGNNMWDPGELIYWAEMVPAIEGVVAIYNQEWGQSIDTLYWDGDPFFYYDLMNPLTYVNGPADALTDGDLLQAVNVAPENVGALREALNTSENFEVGGIKMLFFLDGVSFYFMVPAEVAWHSVTPAGNIDYNPWDEQIVSAGSIWWAGLNQIYNMGGGG